MQSSLSSSVANRSRRRSGFTLLEIVVVLAIAALVSSVTLSGFKELTEGNKRTTCQANLTQVYQALRLYMNDEGGNAPLYYYQNPKDGKTEKNIGLWALWTFPRDNNRNELPLVGDKPIDRYLRNPKVFHCPADDDADRLYLEETDPSDLNGRKKYNLEYLSYQVNSVADPITKIFPTGTTDAVSSRDTETFMPSRITDNTNTLWRRQLDHIVPNTPVAPDTDVFKRANRQPTDDTVVTWCAWHRPPFGSRDRDIVLFMDGTVQQIPVEQENLRSDCTPNSATLLENWQRTPKLPQCTY